MTNAEKLKQVVYRLLRKTGLVGIVDYLFFVARAHKCSRSNELVKADISSMPPLVLMYDAYNHCDFAIYLESGKSDAAVMTKIIDSCFSDRHLNIMEWGCGPARVLRHLTASNSGNTFNKYGSDYNKNTIAWCRKHIEQAEFVENDLMPPLEFASGTFDVIYSISVLTHLSEAAQLAWSKELQRLLKPGGLLVFTVHGEKFKEKLLADELAAFKSHGYVGRSNFEEGKKHYLAFNSEAYMKNILLKDMTQVTYYDQDPFYQDIWSASKI